MDWRECPPFHVSPPSLLEKVVIDDEITSVYTANLILNFIAYLEDTRRRGVQVRNRID